LKTNEYQINNLKIEKMGTLLILVLGASMAGLITSSILMYKLLTAKKNRKIS
jgi:hypothetical protein